MFLIGLYLGFFGAASTMSVQSVYEEKRQERIYIKECETKGFTKAECFVKYDEGEKL